MASVGLRTVKFVWDPGLVIAVRVMGLAVRQRVIVVKDGELFDCPPS